MIPAWILTVIFLTTNTNDIPSIVKYNLKTKEECLAASKFYKNITYYENPHYAKTRVIHVSCYPSYIK